MRINTNLNEGMVGGKRPERGGGDYYDLKSHFPISLGLVFKQCLPWLGGVSLLIAIALWMNGVFGGGGVLSIDLLKDFDFELEVLVAGLLVVLGAKLIYAYLRRLRFKYYILGGHLEIVTGIILRQKEIFPLARISDVAVTRTWLDMLFGIKTVVINSMSSDFAHIEGLRPFEATKCCEYLFDTIENDRLRSKDDVV